MTLGRPKRTDSKPWYRQFWPWLLIFFPATAVVAGIATIIIAVSSDDGLVEADYYKKGLMINFSREMDQRASEFGLSGYVRVDDKSGEVYVLIENASAETQLSNLSVTFKHATRADKDQQVAIEAMNKKEFRGKIAELVAGKWHVLLESGNQWRLVGKIQYPERIDSRLSPATL